MDGLTDPRLNLPANIGGAQSDIIAQLTREMKLQQGSSSASGLFSGSSDANVSSSSSGLGSHSNLNQLIASQTPHSNANLPMIISSSTNSGTPSSISQQILSQLQQDALKLSKLSSSEAQNNLSASAMSAIMTHSAGSSGYKSGGGGLSGMSELVEGVEVVLITDIAGDWLRARGTGDSERGVERGVVAKGE